MQSLSKFREDTGGPVHNGVLHWPGTPDGFPVRTPDKTAVPPQLRGDEAFAINHVIDFHCQLFDLAKPQDHQAFQSVMDRVANGWYHVSRRTDRWPDNSVAPQVWLEWYQIYGEDASVKNPSYAPSLLDNKKG